MFGYVNFGFNVIFYFENRIDSDVGTFDDAMAHKSQTI